MQSLFNNQKPIIPTIHLPALPGAPLYNGDLDTIYQQAYNEALIFQKHGANALIIENFNDCPFYPNNVPAETIAAMAAISREIRNAITIPLGINVLRNDAIAAMAIAASVDAEFIRVNIHTGAMLTDQGIIQGLAYKTLRLKQSLKSQALIFADVAVKHASSLTDRDITLDVDDLCVRGLADAIIVSGNLTGKPADIENLTYVKNHTTCPVLIGSGITLENINDYKPLADGFIVGSYFKFEGQAKNHVDEKRVKQFFSFL